MYIPFVFTLDTHKSTGNFFHWTHFYWYADVCIKNNWPMISHERYFKLFSTVEEAFFGVQMDWVSSAHYMNQVPTTAEMLSLKSYSVSQEKESSLIANYTSQLDCWIDLLENDNAEFEQIISELLDNIIEDFGVKPEGILVYEYLPKALLSAANKRSIPVVFQAGGVLRPPFATELNGFSLLNDNSAESIKRMYDRFLSEKIDAPMLTHKGILRLFVAPGYMKDIHNIDNEPEYEIGVLHNNLQSAIFYIGNEYLSDQEMSSKAREMYPKILIRTRPGGEPLLDALDDSPTCFHFCCKCKRVLGLATKGMIEVILAGRIPHEYGASIFHSFCNRGLEDDSVELAPIELINFILFGLCTPFTWLTDPTYLEFILSGPSEEQRYLRSFHYFTRDISKQDLEFYYMTSGREYRIGDTLYFSTGHLPHQYGSYYCKRGLYLPEATHTWSEGERTEFEFDLVELPEVDLIVAIALYSVMCDNTHTELLGVRCEVNGHLCKEFKLIYGNRYLQFVIPKEFIEHKIYLNFHYDYPRRILVGEEMKRFAIAFEAIRLSEVIQNPFESALFFQNMIVNENCDSLKIQRNKLEEYCEHLKEEVSSTNIYCESLKNEVISLADVCKVSNIIQEKLLSEQMLLLGEKDAIENELTNLSQIYEVIKSELVGHSKNCEDSRIKLEKLENEQNTLLKKNEALAEELARILESKTYRHIVKPILKICGSLKGKRG